MKWLHSARIFLTSFPLSLALILLLMTLLRLPNFVEPYWYGDEGIYLTIGTAIRSGARLYAEIVDHKTPIIYYLAAVGSQLNFRILLYLWMVITTTAYYFIARTLLPKGWSSSASTLIFMFLTTLPWLEGNIPNGELFVMGFVLVGLWILSKTYYYKSAISIKTSERNHSSAHEAKLLFLSGSVAGLGILTKVPGLFDAAVLFLFGYFGLVSHLSVRSVQPKKLWKNSIPTLKSWLFLLLGIAFPILISILYYVVRGSGTDYLQFGLLYNFKYAGTWDLGITNPVLSYFFTLPGKVVFLLIWFVLLTLLRKVVSVKQQVIFGWFGLALVASLLSNRPYPHYFLQVIPPLSLSLVIGFHSITSIMQKKWSLPMVFPATLSGVAVFLIAWLMVLMKVSGYPTASYYTNYLKFITGTMNRSEYFQSFNYLMKENYQVAAQLKQNQADIIFIWGTNPVLYALSETRPVGKFTVAFHIEDLGVEKETMQQLEAVQPEYIIVMKNQYPLPGLRSLLSRTYLKIDSTDHMIVWKKIGS